MAQPTSPRGAERILGGVSPAQFLRRHWQKRPLLVRQALPGFEDPLTPTTLLRLACREDVESRLVLVRGGARPWQVVAGPQDPRRLARLSSTHWTLLVQEVDKHVPGVAALLERFRFIPRWRVDDVMVSLAPRGGTVGPHADGYDVFLIQGRGRRRWQIDERAPEDYRPGLDLRVLRRFRPQRDWVLERGDMLYVPPGVAHYGVALDDCLTYSVGFRAPSHTELVARFLERVVAGIPPERLYGDRNLRPRAEPGLIAPDVRARVRRLIEAECRRLKGRDFDRFVGEILTDPKGPAPPLPRKRVTASQIARALGGGAVLVRAASGRLAFIRRGPREADLFANGRTVPLSPAWVAAAGVLTDRPRFTREDLALFLRRPGFAALLAELINAGAFRVARR